MKRLFTALAFPESVLAMAGREQPEVDPRIRFCHRDQMHVTLHFLGETDPQKVIRLLSLVQAGSFSLQV